MTGDESALSDGKQTLLRALDSIEEIETEMGCQVAYVAVVYSIFKDDEEGKIHDQGGWNHSTAPAWLIAAMLRQAADAVECAVHTAEDEE